MVSLISLNGGQEVNHFPQAPGARSASLATRRSARGAVAPSGPLRSPVRRPFEIAPRRPAVPPATSWPDLFRPSIGPRTREEACRREMPGTSPGMTRRVGRSDGSHPRGRRGLQPTPPLRQPFLILQRRARAPLACLRAVRRAAQSRRPGRFAARFPSVANASLGAARGVCYQGVRAAGPERATARRAEWRVSQASGVSARRLREMKRMKP